MDTLRTLLRGWTFAWSNIGTLATVSTYSFALLVGLGLNFLVLLSFVSAAVFCIGFVMGVLALYASGWVSLRQAVYCDLAVESAPFGMSEVYNIAWADRALKERLSHSVVYEDKDALKTIGNWILLKADKNAP
jgi:hypothetical protein